MRKTATLTAIALRGGLASVRRAYAGPDGPFGVDLRSAAGGPAAGALLAVGPVSSRDLARPGAGHPAGNVPSKTDLFGQAAAA